jgi:hypothetical protein
MTGITLLLTGADGLAFCILLVVISCDFYRTLRAHLSAEGCQVRPIRYVPPKSVLVSLWTTVAIAAVLLILMNVTHLRLR